MERLYILEDVAALLGVKISTVYTYISEGRLKVSKVMGEGYNPYRRYFISESDLDAFIANDEIYHKFIEKRMIQQEKKALMDRLLFLEQQERWDEQFERDFFKGLGL